MNDTDYDQYDKIHTYLLDHGQQELAGHLDRIWQELVKRTRQEPDDEIESVNLNEGETPPETVTEDSRTRHARSGFGYKN